VGYVQECYLCQILDKFVAVPFTRKERVPKCHIWRRTAMVCEGKREEVAEGWRKLRIESLVSCSFHPHSITEKMRLVVDDNICIIVVGKHETKKQLIRRSSIGCKAGCQRHVM
jgi:hypothetical protein